jgi:acyl-CoA thioesterase FadM
VSIVSYWPVRLSLPVEPGDCDDDGHLTAAAVERLFAVARSAYFDKCTAVDEIALEVHDVRIERGAAAVDDEGITISVSVVEVFPESFTMTARLRPAGPSDGDAVAAAAWCSLAPGGEVTTAMRDEFIAHAHAARYTH